MTLISMKLVPAKKITIQVTPLYTEVWFYKVNDRPYYQQTSGMKKQANHGQR